MKDGIYDPTKRFAFTNITDEPFTSQWGGQPITVKPKDVVELPHHLAVKMTTELVDKIMQEEARQDEITTRAANKDPYWRSPKGISMGVPEARKPYEQKILRELLPDEENPQTAIARARIREELMSDMSAEKSAPVTRMAVSQEEFAEIKPKNQ